MAIATTALAQNDRLSIIDYPDTLHRSRLKGAIVLESSLYLSSMTGLYYLWYRDYPSSPFHFFNDNDEWLMMDKAGHITTANYLSKFAYGLHRWAGVKNDHAAIYGSIAAYIYVSTIEVLDGYSAEWGASGGDIAANTLGCGIFLSQQLLWEEQRTILKFSFHQTKYDQYRPDLLGRNLIQNVLKDYNGQTYWLSTNIKSFLPKSSSFPAFLNLAVGYGAEGMTGARINTRVYQGERLPEFERRSQYFLSPDIELGRIKTNSKFLKIFLNTFSFIKIPMPTLEYNKKAGLKFHFLYF